MVHDPLEHLNNLLAQSQAIVRELVRYKVLTTRNMDAIAVVKLTILVDVLVRDKPVGDIDAVTATKETTQAAPISLSRP